MLVRFYKMTDERHRLEVERLDGQVEAVELVTREFLLHDLVHLALEREARISDGVWGLLARGTSFATLNDQAHLFSTEGLRTAEALTGPMQAVFKGQFSADRYVEQFGERYPFVDGTFVARVLERLRKLTGHYRGTSVRGVMTVQWPESFEDR